MSADGFSLRIDTRAAQAALADIERRVRRAQRYAVREAALTLQHEARKRAPVYQGDRLDIPKGRLKRSIRADRRLKVRRDSVSVRVRPRGWPVQAYDAKEEARHPYMRPAYEIAVAQLDVIATRAYEKAMRQR